MDSKSLDEYILYAKEVLSKFEKDIGWAPPNLEQSLKIVTCPHNSYHKIPEDKVESHVRSCKWKTLGYSSRETSEIVECEKALQSNSGGFVSTDSIVSKIAPNVPSIRTNERYKLLLNPDQRLAIYQEEVAQCYLSDKSFPDKALYADLEATAAEKIYQKENPENLSEVELLQKMRDMKKRRQSYRAKNVHITKRSQTEIIRGVLEVHMEELKKLWNPHLECNASDDIMPPRHQSEKGSSSKSKRSYAICEETDEYWHKSKKQKSSGRSHHYDEFKHRTLSYAKSDKSRFSKDSKYRGTTLHGSKHKRRDTDTYHRSKRSHKD